MKWRRDARELGQLRATHLTGKIPILVRADAGRECRRERAFLAARCAPSALASPPLLRGWDRGAVRACTDMRGYFTQCVAVHTLVENHPRRSRARGRRGHAN